MKEKLEKDASIFKKNKQLILTTGILILVVAIVYFVSLCIGGAFHDFCENAVIWVLYGIGLASAVVYMSQEG